MKNYKNFRRKHRRKHSSAGDKKEFLDTTPKAQLEKKKKIHLT